MKKIVITKYNIFVAFMLSMLGFGVSCEKKYVAMYGVPSAAYKVSGKVTSESNVPIEGIRVVMFPDSTLSDVNGYYEVGRSEMPGDHSFPITFKDIDGSMNGSYLQKDTIANFINPQYENGDGAWFDGHTSKEINIQLKKED